LDHSVSESFSVLIKHGIFRNKIDIDKGKTILTLVLKPPTKYEILQLQGKKFDWLQLRDQEERTVLELLQDENF
jgi:hypothetical protein